MIYIILVNILFCFSMEFNSDSAFKYIERQCEIGPRYPGSLGHKKLINYLNNHFSTYADTVEVLSNFFNSLKAFSSFLKLSRSRFM